MRKTIFAGLTELQPGESPQSDNSSFFAENPSLTDHFLQLGAVTHRHDAHDPVPTPPLAPGATVVAAGGSIPADVDVSIGYTLVDLQGGETVLSQAVTVTTPPPYEPPTTPPTATVTYASGSLLADTYFYAVTLADLQGGETTVGPMVRADRDFGQAFASITLDGLTADFASNDAVAWRLYRARSGEPLGYIASGSVDRFVDAGQGCVDCGQTPPVTNRTNRTNRIEVTVPVDGVGSGAAAFRIYGSANPIFPGDCLLGEYPVASAGSAIAYTSLAARRGNPPDVSTSVAGAAKIDADHELVNYAWRSSVLNYGALPSGAVEGDVRMTMVERELYTYVSGEWRRAVPALRTVAGSGGVARGTEHVRFGDDFRITRTPNADDPEWSDEVQVLLRTLVFSSAFVVENTTTEKRISLSPDFQPGGGGGGGTVDGLVWHGAWDVATTYASGSVVWHGGSAYVALEPAPSAGDEPGVSSGWESLPLSGFEGPAGPQGVPGPQGPPGSGGGGGGGGWLPYGDWGTGYSYPQWAVVTHGSAIWVASNGEAGEWEPGTTDEPTVNHWGALATRTSPSGTPYFNLNDFGHPQLGPQSTDTHVFYFDVTEEADVEIYGNSGDDPLLELHMTVWDGDDNLLGEDNAVDGPFVPLTGLEVGRYWIRLQPEAQGPGVQPDRYVSAFVSPTAGAVSYIPPQPWVKVADIPVVPPANVVVGDPDEVYTLGAAGTTYQPFGPECEVATDSGLLRVSAIFRAEQDSTPPGLRVALMVDGLRVSDFVETNDSIDWFFVLGDTGGTYGFGPVEKGFSGANSGKSYVLQVSSGYHSVRLCWAASASGYLGGGHVRVLALAAEPI